ncbi:MGAT1 family protein [Megaselia abdita]
MRTRRYFIAAVFIVLCYVGLFLRGSSLENKISKNKLIEQVQILENRARHELSEDLDLSNSVVQALKDHVASYDEEQHKRLEEEQEGSKENQIEEQPKTVKITEKPLLITSDNQPVIPVLVFACNRVTINKCLDNLIEYRPSSEQFPIIVSQDCSHKETKNVILSYQDQVQLIEQPDQSEIPLPPKEKFLGYYKIARHYGWALNNTFQKGYEFVIVVEDDLNVAPDFFEYFRGTYPLLRNDSTLWCVSAWNDNGKIGLINVNEPEKLYRTDFFPGLGWMLPKSIWSELSLKWPKSFWDDWIRHPEQRKNRVCIRPEISRTRTFGKIGVSHGQFFDKHLKFIHLSDANVNFSKFNLNYLLKW